MELASRLSSFRIPLAVRTSSAFLRCFVNGSLSFAGGPTVIDIDVIPRPDKTEKQAKARQHGRMHNFFPYAFFVTVFCFACTGLYAIRCSMRSRKARAKRDYITASKMAGRALRWSNISLVIGISLWLILGSLGVALLLHYVYDYDFAW